MMESEMKRPLAVSATKGQSIALGDYARTPYATRSNPATASVRPLEGQQRQKGRKGRLVTFGDSTGRVWGFGGKRGRVLTMLATMGQGVTQWDCLPWHTRLGASIHALREAGLEITTEREGEYRHARYRLATPGSLLIHADNREGGA